MGAIAELGNLIDPVISEADSRFLCAIPSREEIQRAVFAIGALKVLRPDGMSALFYHHYWDTVQEDLCDSVKHFFHSGHLLRQLNHSFLVLLPKVENPSCIEQFRSVSLCNVAYKVVSKILTSRLKVVISKLISPFQAAFVPGCLIQENVIIA